MMEWEKDVAYAMTPLKLLTIPLGSWPLQEYNTFALTRHIVCSVGLTVAVTVQCLEIYYSCIGAYAQLDALMYLVCSTLALLKLNWFRLHAEKLTSNYISALNDYYTMDTEEKRAIINWHASKGRTISIIALAITYVDSVIFVVGHASASSQEQLFNASIEGYRTGYAVPSTCTLTHFYIPTGAYFVIFALECLMLVVTCSGNHGCDSLFLHITLHICGQLKILKNHFTNFDDTNPKVHERFNALIVRHGHLIRMSRKLADTISFVLLVQLFLSSMLICILGFQFIIAMKINDYNMMMKSILVLIAFLAQLTVYSVVGDYLKSQMEEVGLSIYQSMWYDFPTKVTKNIIFMMMWSQLPIKLQAGNFIVVDLPTYMSILKTSLSYLSVLRVMVDP